jgi:hypothetical protein
LSAEPFQPDRFSQHLLASIYCTLPAKKPGATQKWRTASFHRYALKEERTRMQRLGTAVLLALTLATAGCQTGSQRQNMTTTGADGQNVGEDSNRKGGPVPGSTTGTEANMQQQPAQQEQQTAPDTSGQAPPRK